MFKAYVFSHRTAFCGCCFARSHYCDVIMGVMASQITSLVIIYSIVHAGAGQRKHQSSASLAFVRGIHRWPVNSLHKRPVTRKMFPFDVVIMDYNHPHVNIHDNICSSYSWHVDIWTAAACLYIHCDITVTRNNKLPGNEVYCYISQYGLSRNSGLQSLKCYNISKGNFYNKRKGELC